MEKKYKYMDGYLGRDLGYVHTVPDSETERGRKCTG